MRYEARTSDPQRVRVPWGLVPVPAVSRLWPTQVLLDAHTTVSERRRDDPDGWRVERSSERRAMRVFLGKMPVSSFTQLREMDAPAIVVNVCSPQDQEFADGERIQISLHGTDCGLAVVGGSVHEAPVRQFDWTASVRSFDLPIGIGSIEEQVSISWLFKGVGQTDSLELELVSLSSFVHGRSRLLATE